MGRFIFLLVSLAVLFYKNDGMLYDNMTGITILTADNVDKLLLQSNANQIWLTQFYAHWCGTCQNFVPKWLKILETVKNWSPIVKVAALDCGNPTNVDACRRYNVSGYPTVRLYWPNGLGRSYHDFGFLAPMKNSEIIKGISQTIVALIANGTYSRQLSSSMRYLLSSHLDADALWEQKVPAKQSLLIVDSAVTGPGNLGPLIGLDTVALSEKGALNVKHVRLSVGETTNAREMLSTYLHLTSIPTDLEFPLLLELDISRRKAVKIVRIGTDSIVKYFFSLILELTSPPTPKSPGDIVTTATVETAWLPEDDLYGAVSYIMMNEVALNAMISKDKVADLRAFLSAVVEFAPFRTSSITQSLEKLHSILNDYRTPSAFSAYDWLQFVKKSGMPNNTPWKHCKGSKPQFRGYPCSLWLLFHSMTVNAAVRSGSSDEITVFPAIHRYVKSFFGCRECAQHFINATRDFYNTPNSDSHLLIWKAHNKANGRLSGSISEDPKSPKIQFPSKDMCPECYKATEAADDSHWNEKAVGAFLLRRYSSESIIPIDSIIVEEDATTNYLTSILFYLLIVVFFFLLILSRLPCVFARICLRTTKLNRCLARHKDDLLPRFVSPDSYNTGLGAFRRLKQV